MFFMAFYCQIIFHCMANAVFVFPVTVDEHLGYLQVLAVVNEVMIIECVLEGVSSDLPHCGALGTWKWVVQTDCSCVGPESDLISK